VNPVIDALAITLAAREPVLLWGAPGIGKSSVVAALADARNERLELVLGSIREPAGIGGSRCGPATAWCWPRRRGPGAGFGPRSSGGAVLPQVGRRGPAWPSAPRWRRRWHFPSGLWRSPASIRPCSAALTLPGQGYAPGTPAAWFLLAHWDW
jgi:hypothetical protein